MGFFSPEKSSLNLARVPEDNDLPVLNSDMRSLDSSVCLNPNEEPAILFKFKTGLYKSI